MRWRGERESSNVEDRRSDGPASGGPMLPVGRGGIGVGTIAVALLAAWLFGADPLEILGLLSGEESPESTAPEPSRGRRAAPADDGGRFASVVLASTEDAWEAIFARTGRQYQAPTLVLYTGRTPTACGTGEAAAGPFYCPGDARLYVDLGFFTTLRERFGATGDAAHAYVIAHEVGHHVQNLVGTMDRMASARQRLPEAQYNRLSVRLELQADCYAGVWAHHSQQSRRWLEPGDLEEALNAAAAVGDDNIQRRARGTVVPESFTHGTSDQRVRWFRAGFEGGRISDCDTFAAR